jgi:hypothetical protein
MWCRELRDMCVAFFLCFIPSLMFFAAIKKFFVPLTGASDFNIIIDTLLIGFFFIFLFFSLQVFGDIILYICNDLADDYRWKRILKNLKRFYVVVECEDGAGVISDRYQEFGDKGVLLAFMFMHWGSDSQWDTLLDDMDFAMIARTSLLKDAKLLFKSEEDAIMFKMMS